MEQEFYKSNLVTYFPLFSVMACSGSIGFGCVNGYRPKNPL